MPDAAVQDRLDSWADIAGYLNRDVKTIQRWERTLGLPVHRVRAGRRHQAIFAIRSELDGWCLSGPELYETSPPDADSPAELAAWVVLTVAIALGLLAVWWKWREGPLPDFLNAAATTGTVVAVPPSAK